MTIYPHRAQSAVRLVPRVACVCFADISGVLPGRTVAYAVALILAETKMSAKLYTPRVLPSIQGCLEGLARTILLFHIISARPSSWVLHQPWSFGFDFQTRGTIAGLSLLTVYVGVVEFAPASPYTYSSSTHRFPDERTPIEATPLSATSAELGLGLGLGLGLDSLSRSFSHALPFFSPPSFHTLAFSPAFTSVWWSA
jgi:hypothetical protein